MEQQEQLHGFQPHAPIYGNRAWVRNQAFVIEYVAPTGGRTLYVAYVAISPGRGRKPWQVDNRRTGTYYSLDEATQKALPFVDGPL
jgi:hypothetical protein